MGIIQKQTIKGSIYSYLGVLIGYVNTILLWPFLLSSEQIGLINILVAISAIFAQFSTLGFTNVTSRLFTYFRDKDKNHNGFVFITVMVGILGFALALATYFILKPGIISHNIEKSELLVKYIYLLIPLIFFRMFFLLLDNYNKMLFDSATGTFLIDFGYRAVNFFLLIAFYFELINFHQYVFGFVVALSFPAVYLAILLIFRKQFNLKPNLKFIKAPLRNEMLSVAVYGVIGGLSGVALSSIDKIMINGYFNLDLTGIYSIAAFFATIILIPNRSLSKISSGFLADAWKSDDHDTINDIYYKSSINQLVAGCFLFLLLIINLENIFRILPEEYGQGNWVLIFISIGNLIAVSTGVSVMILSTSPKYKVQTYLLSALIILTIVTNLIFIPIFGITGAAIASAITLFIYSGARVLYLKLKMNLFPYRSKHLLLMAITIFAAIPSWLIPFMGHWLPDAIIRSAMVGGIFVIALYFLNISSEFNRMVQKLLRVVGVKSN